MKIYKFPSLRTAKQEAIHNVDINWIASGCRPRNDANKNKNI